MDNPSSTVRKAVCVGDYISLAATAPQEAYMHAQALVLTRLGARLTSGGELPPRFHEHVFRVVPALRYEASETLASRRLSRANSLTGKEMADIEAQTRVEREKNDAVLARLDVEPQPEVLYGAKVQLQHRRIQLLPVIAVGRHHLPSCMPLGSQHRSCPPTLAHCTEVR